MDRFFAAALMVLAVLAASSFVSADWFGSGFGRGITGFAVAASANAPDANVNATALGREISANNQAARDQLKKIRDERREAVKNAITARRLAVKAAKENAKAKIAVIKSDLNSMKDANAAMKKETIRQAVAEIKEVKEEAKVEVKGARQLAKEARAAANEAARQKAREILAQKRVANAAAISARKQAVMDSITMQRQRVSARTGNNTADANAATQ